MPRINVYLPKDVYELAERWRASANLSEICARAIRDELGAAEAYRTAESVFAALRPASMAEAALARRYGLVDVLIADAGDDDQIRETLGRLAAGYLDRNICDRSLLAISGGRQMWCMVRNLSPRRVRATITALGIHQADPKLLHAHPNALTTLLSLLYAPRSEAHVIGAGTAAEVWAAELPHRDHPTYFVVSSCAAFDRSSSFAKLLGTSTVDLLQARRVAGDFGYVFLDDRGDTIPVTLDGPQFTLLPVFLTALSRRSDARTILVAGGPEKLDIIGKTLAAKLCNTLITDAATAAELLRSEGDAKRTARRSRRAG